MSLYANISRLCAEMEQPVTIEASAPVEQPTFVADAPPTVVAVGRPRLKASPGDWFKELRVEFWTEGNRIPPDRDDTRRLVAKRILNSPEWIEFTASAPAGFAVNAAKDLPGPASRLEGGAAGGFELILTTDIRNGGGL